MWKKRKLLIWGKTYPEFSKKYYETVCTGAIDAETGRLVRIYPITLRYMEDQFKVFQWIEAEIASNQSDFRPESHKIKQDSIRILEAIGTKDGWAERSNWVLGAGNVFGSVESLLEAEARDHTSLGVVRPETISKFYVRKRRPFERMEWEYQRDAAIQQKDLFVDPETRTRDLQFRETEYRVQFRCETERCKGHDMSILDWGLYVLHDKMVREVGIVEGQKKVLDKLYDLTDPVKRDAHFFLGNTKAHVQSFMVAGIFHPPKAVVKRVPPVEAQVSFGF